MLLLAAAGLGSVALARAGQPATLCGEVRDPAGLPVPHATVTAVHEGNGFRHSTRSGDNGVYCLEALQSGAYRLSVRRAGFRMLVRFGVVLEPAQAAGLDFELQLGSLEETVTVHSGPLEVAPTGGALRTTLPSAALDRLPLNGKGLLALLELVPGAISTPATRGEPGQLSANGQRPNGNHFSLDGISVNNGVSAGGLPVQATGGTLPALTAFGSLAGLATLGSLAEFSVVTSSGSPEFGRLPGAQVALQSRSGSAEWHGSAGALARNGRLDAADWFANRSGMPRPPASLVDASATLGGPLGVRQTYFFASYEALRMRQPVTWRSAVPSLALRARAANWLKPVLDLFPLPNGPSLSDDLADWSGSSSRPGRLDSTALRLDRQAGDNARLFLRYAEAPSATQFGSRQVNQLSLRSRQATAGASLSLNPQTSLELRANYSLAGARSHWGPSSSPGAAPCYLEQLAETLFSTPDACTALYRFSIAGVGQALAGTESRLVQQQWQTASSLRRRLAAHELHFGFDFRQLAPRRHDGGGSLNVMVENISDLPSVDNLWTSTSPALDERGRLTEASFSARDTWQARPGLSLSFGVRWELTPAPRATTISTTPFGGQSTTVSSALWPMRYDYWAPHFGLAWRPAGLKQSTLRAGVGLFYQSSLTIATDLINGGPLSVSKYYSAAHAPFASQLSYGFADALRLPAVLQVNLAWEQALGPAQSVQAAYSGASGFWLLRRELTRDGGDPLSRVVLATNHGASDYQSLQLSFRRRLQAGLSAWAAYTWSHSIDNSSSDSQLYLVGGGLSAAADRGSSDFDIRHNFSLALSYDAPHRLGLGGWSLDAMLRLRSGFPLNLYSDAYTLGLRFANAYRPNLVGGAPIWLDDGSAPGGRRLNGAAFSASSAAQGNLGRGAIAGFGMGQLDLAIHRSFRLSTRQQLEFRLEAYNAANHASFADPFGSLASPLFGQSPSMLNLMLGSGSPGSGLAPMFQSGGARALQFGLRYRF